MRVFNYCLLFFLFSFSTSSFCQSSLPKDRGFAKEVTILEVYKINFDDDRLELLTGYYNTEKKFRCSFLMLNNLAKAAEIISEQDAFNCINSFLTSTFESNSKEFEASEARNHKAAAILLAPDQSIQPRRIWN